MLFNLKNIFERNFFKMLNQVSKRITRNVIKKLDQVHAWSHFMRIWLGMKSLRELL